MRLSLAPIPPRTSGYQSASAMAPIALSSRLSAAIIKFVATRDPEPQARTASSPTLNAVAARFHAASIPDLASRTLKTALDTPSRVLLHARQQTNTIPGEYPGLNDGPDPGTIVGITLGSVGGFLLLLWLVYTCLQIGGRGDTVSSYGTASVVTRKSRRRHSRHHHRSPARRETVEIRTSRVPPPPPQPTERVVVEERTERRTSSQAPPPPPAAMPPMHAHPPPRIVTDDEDEVVVIEEHSPAPRRTSHKSKTHRRRSSSARRESGFREVDPDRFAGGDASFREVRRSSRHGR